jgi:alpha-methylacyl-CoA racemase
VVGSERPLDGVTVLDASRMLPGAILARQLLDFGARVVKIEDPGGGDPMRQVPPLVGGMSAAFAALYPGAESVALDLRRESDASRFRTMAAGADVVVETFRPGAMEKWGVGSDTLTTINPSLIYCSMSSWGRGEDDRGRIGHDLNFVASSGLLGLLSDTGIPSVQVADVGAALLASSAILGALLVRHRTGRGAVIDQPLATGPAPFLAWAWADRAAGGGVLHTLLSGRWPCYRRYRCRDGLEVAVSTLEPKFWMGLLGLLDLTELAPAGIDEGEAGQAAAAAIQEILEGRDRAEWLEIFEDAGLPVSAVHDIDEARSSGVLEAAGVAEGVASPAGDGRLAALGPFVPSVGRTPDGPAPGLDAHGDEFDT